MKGGEANEVSLPSPLRSGGGGICVPDQIRDLTQVRPIKEVDIAIIDPGIHLVEYRGRFSFDGVYGVTNHVGVKRRDNYNLLIFSHPSEPAGFPQGYSEFIPEDQCRV